MSASSDRLGSLHEMFTGYWELRMRQAMDPDPEVRIPISAAEQSVIRAFLKDNGVQADVTGNKELEQLDGELRKATAGLVSNDEMDDIMADFAKQMHGTMQ
ncbi:terminase small subunit [Pseudomonas phage vB_PpuP-Luutsna-3]